MARPVSRLTGNAGRGNLRLVVAASRAPVALDSMNGPEDPVIAIAMQDHEQGTEVSSVAALTCAADARLEVEEALSAGAHDELADSGRCRPRQAPPRKALVVVRMAIEHNVDPRVEE